MNTEEELQIFRNTWKYELANNCQNPQVTAKKLYLRGVQLEREGYCYEAIEYFRQALKVAPDIEKHIDIRNDTSCTPLSDSSNILGFEEDEDQSISTSASSIGFKNTSAKNFETSQMNFSGTISCFAEKSRSELHISVLPNEILLHVFRFVISTELDLKSLENIEIK